MLQSSCSLHPDLPGLVMTVVSSMLQAHGQFSVKHGVGCAVGSTSHVMSTHSQTSHAGPGHILGVWCLVQWAVGWCSYPCLTPSEVSMEHH